MLQVCRTVDEEVPERPEQRAHLGEDRHEGGPGVAGDLPQLHGHHPDVGVQGLEVRVGTRQRSPESRQYPGSGGLLQRRQLGLQGIDLIA